MTKEWNVLLIIDNMQSHPSVNLLERENGHFKVLLLPLNVMGLLYLMDKSITECMKETPLQYAKFIKKHAVGR